MRINRVNHNGPKARTGPKHPGESGEGDLSAGKTKSEPRRLRRYLLLALIGLVVLVPAAWLFENWRGAKVWEEAKTQAEAAGVLLNLEDYVEPEIPDDENLRLSQDFKAEFEMEEAHLDGFGELLGSKRDSIFEGMIPAKGRSFSYGDWFEEKISEEEAQKRVAKLTKVLEERIALISSAILETPVHSIFYGEDAKLGVYQKSEWVLPIIRFSRGLYDSGLLAIRQNVGEVAVERIVALFRLSRAVATPRILSLLVSDALKEAAYALVWEGIRLRLWEDSQLLRLSHAVDDPGYRENLLECVKYQAAFSVRFLELGRDLEVSYSLKTGKRGKFDHFLYTGGPEGWFDRRRAFLVEKSLELAEVVRTEKYHQFKEIEEAFGVSEWSPAYGVAEEYARTSSIGLKKAGRPIAEICKIAIAAEREFLKSGSYPESLEGLALDFPVIDRTDPAERSLAYELGPKGRPQIWSRYQEELGEEGDEMLRWQFWSEEKK